MERKNIFSKEVADVFYFPLRIEGKFIVCGKSFYFKQGNGFYSLMKIKEDIYALKEFYSHKEYTEVLNSQRSRREVHMVLNVSVPANRLSIYLDSDLGQKFDKMLRRQEKTPTVSAEKIQIPIGRCFTGVFYYSDGNLGLREHLWTDFEVRHFYHAGVADGKPFFEELTESAFDEALKDWSILVQDCAKTCLMLRFDCDKIEQFDVEPQYIRVSKTSPYRKYQK